MSDFYGSRQEITEKGNLFYRQAGNACLMLETIESGENGKDGGSEAEHPSADTPSVSPNGLPPPPMGEARAHAGSLCAGKDSRFSVLSPSQLR